MNDTKSWRHLRADESLPKMSCDKEDVSPKLDIVLIASGETGARQRHLLNEHGEAVAGGGKVQLQVAFELLAPYSWQQSWVHKIYTE